MDEGERKGRGRDERGMRRRGRKEAWKVCFELVELELRKGKGKGKGCDEMINRIE